MGKYNITAQMWGLENNITVIQSVLSYFYIVSRDGGAQATGLVE